MTTTTNHADNKLDKKRRTVTMASLKNDGPTATIITDQPNLKGDWLNVFLLLLLYTVQGLPLGLIGGIPLILQSKKNASFRDQALFTLVGVPYSIKLLWAPLVDAIYLQRMGRRKSWLVPVQLLTGVCFVYIAGDIEDMLPETGRPKIEKLTYVFSVCTFLIATQDIVVDGWALTILKKENVGYASTCNTTGLTLGLMIGSICSTLLTSEEFCNKYLRAAPHAAGMTTLKSIFHLLGIIYFLVTVLIAVFKKEKDCTLSDGFVKLDAYQNYKLLFKMFKLRSIQILAAALLTVKIGFAATESVSNLKLIDAGVSKENITVINTGMFAVKMIIPIVIAKYTSGPKPMSVYLKATLLRLFWNIAFVVLIYYTPYLIKSNGFYYYVILVFVLLVQDILTYSVFVAVLSFFSRISDPRYGGTYMTLLNTLSNMGNAWTSFVILGAVDHLTIKECSVDKQNNCATPDLQHICKTNDGDCTVTVNGYYIEMIGCTVIGIVWYAVFRNVLKRLQNLCPTQWLVRDNTKQSITTKNTNNVFSIS